MAEPNPGGKPLCHFDVIVSENSDVRSYLEQAFNWSVGPPEGGPYCVIIPESGPKGGFWDMTKEMVPLFITVFRVDDRDAFLNNLHPSLTAVYQTDNHPLGGKYAVIRGKPATGYESMIFGIHESSDS